MPKKIPTEFSRFWGGASESEYSEGPDGHYCVIVFRVYRKALCPNGQGWLTRSSQASLADRLAEPTGNSAGENEDFMVKQQSCVVKPAVRGWGQAVTRSSGSCLPSLTSAALPPAALSSLNPGFLCVSVHCGR